MSIYITSIEQTIIDKVFTFRKKNKLSQKQLSAALDRTESFVGNVESAKHPLVYNIKHITILACFYEEPIHTFVPEWGCEETIKKRKPVLITENKI